ncbi:programmed cell death 1 ligand 1-like isoform X2 [Clinocottus analis]|uniref:programmed cell death 1 ligand 1-like isoform X2 n=1 Tax=Clinocottus analis TaxID=304258 RepID=UPI0035C10B32
MTCRILLLFILSSGVCGSFVVNVTQSFYQAKENHNIMLEWSFTTNTGLSLNSLSVFCRLFTDVKDFFLLHVHQGVEVPESQDQHFAGRVQLDKDVLGEGRVRLQVSRLRTADSGVYVCDVLTSYGTDFGECQLLVSAARDRPEPETTNGTSLRKDSQPESRGRIGLHCALGLTTAALVLSLLVSAF